MSTHLQAVVLLSAARRYIKRGWCRTALALDAAGRMVSPRSPEACTWCLLGALERAKHDAERSGVQLPLDTYRVAAGLLRDAIEARFPHQGGPMALSWFNDVVLQSQQEADDFLFALVSSLLNAPRAQAVA
jgi:hypothetical protein